MILTDFDLIETKAVKIGSLPSFNVFVLKQTHGDFPEGRIVLKLNIGSSKNHCILLPDSDYYTSPYLEERWQIISAKELEDSFSRHYKSARKIKDEWNEKDPYLSFLLMGDLYKLNKKDIKDWYMSLTNIIGEMLKKEDTFRKLLTS